MNEQERALKVAKAVVNYYRIDTADEDDLAEIVARHVPMGREDELAEAVEARDAWLEELRSLGRALGYKRAYDDDFGEVDMVPMRKLANQLRVLHQASAREELLLIVRTLLMRIGDRTGLTAKGIDQAAIDEGYRELRVRSVPASEAFRSRVLATLELVPKERQ